MLGTVLIALMAWAAPGDSLFERDTCGRECLRQIASFHERDDHKPTFDALLPTGKAPFMFEDLITASRQLGYHAEAVTWQDPSAASFPCPAILHVRGSPESDAPNHFVNCYGVRNGKLVIGDAPGVIRLVDPKQMQRVWNGNALYVSPNEITWKDASWLSRPLGRVVIVICLCVGLWLLGSGLEKHFNGLVSRTLGLAPASVKGLSAVAILLSCVTLWGVWTGWELKPGGDDKVVRHELPRGTGETRVAPRPETSTGLVGDPETIILERSDLKEQKTLSGTVRIRNTATINARITGVNSSCSCLKVEDVVGKQIAVGATLDLPFQISISDDNAVFQTITVTPQPGLMAASVVVRVPDRDAIPRVLRRDQHIIHFNRPGQIVAASVVAIENEGSKPWISAFRCTPLEFRIDGELQVESEARRGYILRTYTSNVMWTPHGENADMREIYGNVSAVASTDGASTELPIGATIASTSHPCHPSIVTLSSGHPRETVFCGASFGANEWAFIDQAHLPKWLNVGTRMVDGRLSMDINMNELPPTADEVDQVSLSLRDTHGRVVKLPITIAR